MTYCQCDLINNLERQLVTAAKTFAFAGTPSRLGMGMSDQAWSDKEILEALRADAERKGRSPTVAEWQRASLGRPTSWTVKKRFGSWVAACEKAGLSGAFEGRSRWSRDRIIYALVSDAKTRGRAATSHDWRTSAADHPTAQTVVAEFGSWKQALEAAGLEPGWTKKQIIKMLREDTKRRGDPPTGEDWNKPASGRPTTPTVCAVFGSWRAALEAARLLPTGVGEIRWTKERIVDALRADASAHGSHPRAQEWRSKGPGRPTAQVVRRRFGSWQAAIAAADLHEWPERQPEPADFTMRLFRAE